MGSGVVVLGEIFSEVFLFDVAIAVAIFPVAEIVVVQLVDEEADDAVLSGAFWFADGVHIGELKVES